MTTTTDRPAVTEAQQQALTRLNDAIEGLRALRSLVLDRPDIANAVNHDMADDRAPRVLVYVSDWVTGGKDIDGHIAGLGMAALEHGATVNRTDDEKYRAITARFGFLKLYVYTEHESEASAC